jgi:hypothetical protein
MEVEKILIRTDTDIVNFARAMVADSDKKAYLDKVYKILLSLLPGRSLTIEKLVKTENLETFYKCVCLFIQERPDFNIQFSNDYSQVIRK